MTIILETERLLFRHLVMDDLAELFALYSDPEMRRYFPDGALTFEDTKDELEWFLHGHPNHPELGLWATIHKKTNKFIGRCGLLPWIIDDRLEVEVAYMIAKDHWGQGLATETAQGILQYGFEKLNLSSIICLMHPDNLASQRVAQKVGMTLERQVNGIAGDHFPTLIYSINK